MKKEANYLKKDEPDVFSPNTCGRYQQFLWDLMEKPDTSIAAKVSGGNQFYRSLDKHVTQFGTILNPHSPTFVTKSFFIESLLKLFLRYNP